MFKILAGILLSILLYGCTTLSEHHERIIALEKGRIGILAIQPYKLDDTTSTYLRDVYRETVLNTFTYNGVRNVQYIDEAITSQDSAFIRNQAIEMCRRNNLDAIIISGISNVQVNNEYKTPGVPVGISLGAFSFAFGIGGETGRKIDLDLEMKLFGRDGLLLMISKGTSRPGMVEDRRPPEEILTSAIKNASKTIAKNIMYKYW
ncbi:MAG TPA: hypothetical protein VEC36_06985 [Patescibacteria group bacterium]|nr:hypothetical protein [Patescibacteria group bacterium]